MAKIGDLYFYARCPRCGKLIQDTNPKEYDNKMHRHYRDEHPEVYLNRMVIPLPLIARVLPPKKRELTEAERRAMR